jgi:asparagine synthase (glutamine-hydrolysing)
MCGICGTAGFVDRGLIERMTTIISHRGPDDAGIYLSETAQVGLGNRRLSIIDLSPAGHMPMSNEDGRVWITHNGEIYNFRELRDDLEVRGHRFQSNTDTEVIIHGYEEWGVNVLNKLNGMFALALLDLRQSHTRPKLLLARDRLGIKPLYYTTIGDRMLFGSEIKSLLLSPEVQRHMNFEALHRYLAFRWVAGPETLFDGIYKLMPGHYLLWENGQCSSHRYWDLHFDVDQTCNEQALVEEMRSILDRSIARHLISDVPLAVFLSGGLDSSAILALASRQARDPITAYTVAYRREDGRLEQSDEDAKYAQLVAKRFGAKYHEIILEPDVVELLPKVVWHLDEPVSDAAAISTYLICTAARSNAKVLLSGQGADEVFAGYRVHLSYRLSEMVRLIPESVRNGPVQQMLGVLPLLHNKVPGVHPGLLLAFHRYFAKLLRGASLSNEERYVAFQAYCTDQQLRQLYSPAVRERLVHSVAGQRHMQYFDAVADQDFLNRMLYVDAKTFLPELNLTYSDKLSMAQSVEIRVPFLDTELIEFAARVPSGLKLRRLTTKYILKKALTGVVPEPVIRRRKAGFGAPTRMWLRRDLPGMLDDLFSEVSIRKRGLFDPQQVRRLIADDRQGIEDYSYRVWMLLTLELWQRTFLDSAPECSVNREFFQGVVAPNKCRSDLSLN